MFRIYRDTRFSRDKRPYKTHAAAQFRHVCGRDVHAPGFYVHLGPEGVFAGCGIWHPDGSTLSKIRDSIVDRSKEWKRIFAGKAFRETLSLGGDSLKRAPRGYDPDHALVEDLKRKDFYTFVELEEADACARDFLDRYARICRMSAPFTRFLTEAIGLDQG